MNLVVLDNSLVKTLKCLLVPRKTLGTVGDMVLGVVKREWYGKRAMRKRFFYAIIMATKRAVFRQAGAYYVRFRRSGVLLLSDDREKLIGSRFYCRIPLEVRKSNFREICQYSRRTV